MMRFSQLIRWTYVLLFFLGACETKVDKTNLTSSPEKKEESSGSNVGLENDTLALSGEGLWEFFYPQEEEPYIYAFLDEYNPIGERFYRYISMEKQGKELFVIEQYNESLRIFEGFTLDPSNDFEIIDHMKVDRDGIKRSSRLTKNQYFPRNKDEQAVFIADFPSHLDSVLMVYESRKNVLETDLEIEVMGENLNAIKLVDSVRVHLVNTFTKAINTQEAIIYRYYAEGKGQVRFEGEDTEAAYKLNKVLPDSWWMEYAM